MKNNYYLLTRSISLLFLLLTITQIPSFGQGLNPNTACNLALTTQIMQAEPWYMMQEPFNGTGSIDLTVKGGTAPYTYRWNTGVATQDLSVASPGMYSVSVTDATGCTAMTTVDVGTENNPMVLTSSHINTSKAGGTDGSVNLSIIGGTGPYTYRWSNGVTTEDLTGIMAGSYSVIVTDAMGKQATTTLMVSNPGLPLSLYIAHQNVMMADGYGSIDLTIVGGAGPYTYQWNGGSQNEDLTQVTPGLYTVTVTDAAGAMATASVNVLGFGMTAIVTITDCNRNGWVDQRNPNTLATFTTGKTPSRLGNGSLEYTTSTGALGNFRNLSYHNTLLSSLTTFSYASYIQSRTNNTDNILVVLQVDRTGDGLEDDRLIFEPRWQTGSWVAGVLPDQGPTVERTWQTWDMLQAIWWFGPPKDVNPEKGGEYFTLASYIHKYPKASIVNQPIGGGFGGIRLNVGSPRIAPWPEYWGAAFTGYVDAFTVGVNGQTTIYNFEQCSTNAFAFKDFKSNLINQNSELELLWQVTNDENTTSYEIQKSADGVTFSKLAIVPRHVHNLPDGTYTYQFNDKYLFTGANYYRIMRVGNDGSFTYSNVISVNVQFAFIDFQANRVSNTELALLWRVVNEANTTSYDIERSTNGVDFTRIGNLPRFMHHLPAREFTYQFNDKQVVPGMNYYRLKQIGTDGSMVYSNIISYNNTMMAASMTTARKPNSTEESIAATKELRVYPNPASERVQVSFTLSQAGAYGLALYEIRGALVKTLATGKAKANQPLSHELTIGAYAKGIYLLKVVSDKQVMTKRMVIEH